MASPRQQEWNIRPRANCCVESGRAFEDGEAFYSRLVEGEEGYLREDLSVEAWSDEHKASALSTWKSTFHVPPPPAEEPLKPETLEEAIRALMAGDDPEDHGAIFILAMQLERKRKLVPRARQRKPDGSLLLVYEHKQSGDIFLIPDPEWSLDEIAEVQERVAIRLGWIEPEPDPDADDGAANADEEATETEAVAEDDTSADVDPSAADDPSAVDDTSAGNVTDVEDDATAEDEPALENEPALQDESAAADEPTATAISSTPLSGAVDAG